MFLIQTIEKNLCHKEDDNLTQLTFRSIGYKRLHLGIQLEGGRAWSAEVQIETCLELDSSIQQSVCLICNKYDY